MNTTNQISNKTKQIAMDDKKDKGQTPKQNDASLVKEIVKLKTQIEGIRRVLVKKNEQIRDLNKSIEVLLDEKIRLNTIIHRLEEENEALKNELSFEKANNEYYEALPWYKRLFKF